MDKWLKMIPANNWYELKGTPKKWQGWCFSNSENKLFVSHTELKTKSNLVRSWSNTVKIIKKAI